MQSGENGSLAQVNRRSRERKGLEAIFTSQKEGMKIEILTGAAGIMAGLFLSVVALFRADAPQALGPWGDTIYSALTFGSLGALLVICGGWHNHVRDCGSRNQATDHISLPNY